MKEKYSQIFWLLDQQEAWKPRLDKIHEIVQQPDFKYKVEDGANLILSVFLRSCYWLDKELFYEDYLYNEKKDLLPIEKTHLKMVQIGVSLMEKGFPLAYNPAEYAAVGPNQVGTYVKAFVAQCHKKYALLHDKIAHQDCPVPFENQQKIRN